MDPPYNPNIAQRRLIDKRTVKSAARALEILELFDELQRPLHTAEVSSLLNYPFSSTAAVLNTLVERGYLRRDPEKRTFAPSLRLALLGNWVGHRLAGSSDILVFMQALHEATGRTIALQWRNGLHLQFVHVIEAHGRPDWHFAAGMVRPLLTSSGGGVLVSQLLDDEIGRIISRHNAERNPGDERVHAPAFMEAVNCVRREGHLFVRDAAGGQWATLSSALPQRIDEPLMAVTIGGDADEMERDRPSMIEHFRSLTAAFLTGP